MTGTVWDRIFANLVTALEAINGSAVASSTVDVDSASGQKILNVAATTGFVAGSMVKIGDGTAGEEVGRVASIQVGVSLTLDENLDYTHTALQADTVKQDWYNVDVNYVKSWARLRIAQDAPFPAASLMAHEQRAYEPDELAGNYQHWTRRCEVMMLDRTRLEEPTDQSNDTIYQELLADVLRALLTDRTRGGHAMETRVLSSQPVTEEVLMDKSSELALVGALVEFEVDYRHLFGDAYAHA